MTRERIRETDQGIQEETDVAAYDVMQKSMRDRGWIETRQLVSSGITQGMALEVGPGPGYLGLEWLKTTDGTRLTAVEISAAMISIARRNCAEYGLEGRAEYVRGDGGRLPFPDASFDSVFTNGSLHEWADPVSTLDNMWRVLKPGGCLFVSDLRRDMSPVVRWFLWITVRPARMRPGLITSLRAAYTCGEVEDLIRETRIESATVTANPFGLVLTARK